MRWPKFVSFAANFTSANLNIKESSQITQFRSRLQFSHQLQTLTLIALVSISVAVEECVLEGMTPGDFPKNPLLNNKGNELTVRIARRGWLSAEIVAHILSISLGIGGLRNELVDMTSRSSKHIWRCDLSHDDCSTEERDYMVDVDPESWRLKDDQYDSIVREKKRVFDAGPLGYVGQSGLYYAPKSLGVAHPKLLLHFAGAHASLHEVPRFFPANAVSGGFSDFAWSQEYSPWRTQGRLDEATGLWIPQHCDSSGLSCGQVYHADPSWDTGIIESLVLAHALPYNVQYLGEDFFDKLTSHLGNTHAAPILHYGWMPDPFISLVSSERVGFLPAFSSGCAPEATIGYRKCDFAVLELFKPTSRKLRMQMAPAFVVVQRLKITVSEISALMELHVSGGGTLTSPRTIACNFVNNNLKKVQRWAKGCPPNTTLDRRFLLCVPECERGLEINATGDGCQLCSIGRFQPAKGMPCQDCDLGFRSITPGATRCEPCYAGRFANSRGQSNCTVCPIGKFASTPAAIECQNCTAGKFGAINATTACVSCARGKFSAVDGTSECIPCSGKGMTTAWTGAWSQSSCVCPAKTFLRKHRCHPCDDEYMRCQSEFGTDNFKLKDGFMSLATEPDKAYHCAFAKACPGVRDPFDPKLQGETCVGGHTGVACFRCVHGKAGLGDRCVSCEADPNDTGFLGLPLWHVKYDVIFGGIAVFFLCIYVLQST